MVNGLTVRDFDEALADSLDELPQWVLDELQEVVVRVEMRPPEPAAGGGVATLERSRLVLYREPVLAYVRSAGELQRVVRAELVRALVRHLDLDGQRAAELATAYY